MELRKKIYLSLIFISLFLCNSSCRSNHGFIKANGSVNNLNSEQISINKLVTNNSNNKTTHINHVGDKNGESTLGAMRFCDGIRGANTVEKVVALTFDDGPHKKHTNEILEILQQYKVKATFFFIGKNVEKYLDIVKAVHAGGHVIGNHTYSHYRLTKLSDSEIEAELTKANDLIYSVIRNSPALFRPPYGACTSRTAHLIKNLGFKTIMWNSTADDCHVDRITSAGIAAGVLKLVKPGAIIALHDGGGNREKTVAALPLVIETLKAAGYEFLTVPELLNLRGYFPPSDDKIAFTPPLS